MGTSLLSKPPWGLPRGISWLLYWEHQTWSSRSFQSSCAMILAPDLSTTPCISCAGALRGTTLRFCGKADLAEKSSCDGAMLKEPLLLDFSPFHKISGTNGSMCTVAICTMEDWFLWFLNTFEIFWLIFSMLRLCWNIGRFCIYVEIQDNIVLCAKRGEKNL